MFGDATTTEEISQILKVPVSRLQNWTDQGNDLRYAVRIVNSQKGKPRRVFAPKDELKNISRALRSDLIKKSSVLRYSHGFVQGRTTRTNAEVHLGQPVVWKVDVKNAFQSISRPEIEKLLKRTYSPQLAEMFAGWVCRNDWLVPGNPAAPDLFNYYTVPMVWVLAYMAKEKGLRFSAYADDFYFSGEKIGPKFRSAVISTLSRFGFKAHEFGTPKNRLMLLGKDVVVVTGLRLTQEGEVRLPRPVFGEGTRLIKELKAGRYPTEKIFLARPKEPTGEPVYDTDRLERETRSAIGYLQYCYQSDSHFREWAERQLAAPEHSHILAIILGKDEAKRRGITWQIEKPAAKPEPVEIEIEVEAKAKTTPKEKVLAKATTKRKKAPQPEESPTLLSAQSGAMISDLLRMEDLVNILSVSKSTINRMEKKGEFPPRVRLSANIVGWHEKEVQAWLNAKPRGIF